MASLSAAAGASVVGIVLEDPGAPTGATLLTRGVQDLLINRNPSNQKVLPDLIAIDPSDQKYWCAGVN